MYRRLQVDLILRTAETLEQRIDERFPGSGLLSVARELISVVRDGQERLGRLGRPIWAIRVASGAGAIMLVGALVGAGYLAIQMSRDLGSRADVVQATQALLDEIVLVGIAVLFLFGLEARAKRSDALRTLHQYRSMAHVIDMHQLTKDPERLSYPSAARTTSSPNREMTAFRLGRYLDYCSELLSVISKMAALHVQDLGDPVLLGAVRDVESLTGSLQVKIWQKKLILDVHRLSHERRAGERRRSVRAVQNAEGATDARAAYEARASGSAPPGSTPLS